MSGRLNWLSMKLWLPLHCTYLYYNFYYTDLRGLSVSQHSTTRYAAWSYLSILYIQHTLSITLLKYRLLFAIGVTYKTHYLKHFLFNTFIHKTDLIYSIHFYRDVIIRRQWLMLCDYDDNDNNTKVLLPSIICNWCLWLIDIRKQLTCHMYQKGSSTNMSFNDTSCRREGINSSTDTDIVF